MERKAFRLPGFAVLGWLVVVAAAVLPAAIATGNPVVIGIASVVISLVVSVAMSSFQIVNPNEARVVQFFGRYIGTVSEAGFHWLVPFTNRQRVTLRVRNFETAKLKVNDADGNPVEIAAVVVWQVFDTAKAAFAVDDYEQYVAIQSEAAVRHLATCYPYDAHDSDRIGLRDGAQVAEELTVELRERVALAGVEVLESRITHLAYAPEIAQAMLVRQQANAVVAARARLVEGAVGMVEMALQQLAEHDVVELDEERRATMVSNLLVVLCGDRATQPVVNVGSLYS